VEKNQILQLIADSIDVYGGNHEFLPTHGSATSIPQRFAAVLRIWNQPIEKLDPRDAYVFRTRLPANAADVLSYWRFPAVGRGRPPLLMVSWRNFATRIS
jgi:hypothetical protein